MKIIYCINAVTNAGGMEKILQQKANYLADILNYEVIIVTTEQNGLPPFFSFSHRIRFVDLDINYCDRADKKEMNIIWKIIWKNCHKYIHKHRIKKLLNKEKADIVVSLINNDIGFLYKIHDGSKKIIEFHFNHDNKIILASNWIIKTIQSLRMKLWKRHLSHYDYFVVLTEEDKKEWGHLDNIVVIPNFILKIPEKTADIRKKRIISVGRMSYEKGHDRLLLSWWYIQQKFPDWELYIFGTGNKEWLYNIINEKKLMNVHLENATTEILDEYCKSSLFVMCSRCEGFGLVLVEAMSCGLPIISFDCPCGPKDILHEKYGTLVPNGDIEGLANATMKWMSDETKRFKGSMDAREAAKQYTQKEIMKKWIELFES